MTDHPAEIDPCPEVVEQHVTAAQTTTRGLQRLAAEVEAMKNAATMARGIAASGFVPDHWLKDKTPDQAVASMATAILYGAELGMSAMRSVNELFIVRGKPSMYARTASALVRAAGYVMEPVEETDERVVWKAYRDGTWKFSEWTMERAKQAGYTSNTLYQKNPKEMLRSKAIMELCRITFPDVLMGLDYSVDELQLIDTTVQRVGKKLNNDEDRANLRGKGGLAALQKMATEAPDAGKSTPANEIKEKPTTEREAKPKKGKAVTQQQIGTIHGLAGDRGVIDFGDGSDMVPLFQDLSNFMGESITNWKQITFDDAQAYMESLQKIGLGGVDELRPL